MKHFTDMKDIERLLHERELIIKEMKSSKDLMILVCGEHEHPSLNEEYEKIATKYHNNKITREEFLEEYEMLKVAMKLIDE